MMDVAQDTFDGQSAVQNEQFESMKQELLRLLSQDNQLLYAEPEAASNGIKVSDKMNMSLLLLTMFQSGKYFQLESFLRQMGEFPVMVPI